MDDDLKHLEQRVDDLIRLCGKLKEENDDLRLTREGLLEEHTKLTEKNRMARARLETIIDRLRSLEKG
ncbi:MAG: TIGR02449 family protein [Gammaproteobacteria bacterium]|nr:TIGR02449 family protein [Gammaproteobacteria bacterium]MDH3465888.1 TIGR02449 family protein [Gammaproteobacteria bacterium]